MKKKQQQPKSELDIKISEALAKKKTLLIQNDKREISDSEFAQQIAPLDKEIRSLTMQKIEVMKAANQERINKPNPEPPKLVKVSKPTEVDTIDTSDTSDTSKEPKKEKPVYTPTLSHKKKQSCIALIIKALKHPKVDTEDKIVAIVHYWEPRFDKHNIRVYLLNVISMIKNNNERFNGLTWDNEKYMVIENE